MKLKVYVIDFETPRWLRKTIAYVVPALLIGGISVAYASVKHTFNAGDPLKAADLMTNFTDLDARLALLEGAGDCPAGYTKSGTAASFLPSSTVCKKGSDEVVKVGTGGSAFWIDRYEASVWVNADGTGGQKFAGADDSTTGFPHNGQVTTPLYALSVTNVIGASRITWFQAVEACAASGKRLPTGQEWLRAARGTADPAAANAGLSNARCNTQDAGPRPTGAALGSLMSASCVSDWGAEDMIGNLGEWTEEWYAAPGNNSPGQAAPWPDSSYGADITANLASSALTQSGTWTQGAPAAAHRGGWYSWATQAGIFALGLDTAPSMSYSGFRCVVPR